MHCFRGGEIFAIDPKGFRRRIIDDGEGPIRSYAYSPPDDGELPYHCHAESTEIHAIIAGAGTMIVDGEEIAIAAPDIVVCAPGEFHSMRSGPEPLRLLAVVAPNTDDLVWPDEEPQPDR